MINILDMDSSGDEIERDTDIETSANIQNEIHLKMLKAEKFLKNKRT